MENIRRGRVPNYWSVQKYTKDTLKRWQLCFTVEYATIPAKYRPESVCLPMLASVIAGLAESPSFSKFRWQCDGLPAQICSSCSNNVRTIEDVLQCLKEMRNSAKKVVEHFLGQSENLKRMKDTSGPNVDVSPDNARSRPAAKRRTPLTPRQLNFEPTENDEIHCTLFYSHKLL